MKILKEGVLEILQDGFGFYLPDYLIWQDQTIYMYLQSNKAIGLRTGILSKAKSDPKDGERYFAILKIEEINFEEPDKTKNKPSFENLTPLFPDERMLFELGTGSTEDLSRVIDLTAPTEKDKGQLIVHHLKRQNLIAKA